MEPTTTTPANASANLRLARQTAAIAFLARLKTYPTATLRAMLSRRRGRPQDSQYVVDVQAELVTRRRPACIVDDESMLPF